MKRLLCDGIISFAFDRILDLTASLHTSQSVDVNAVVPFIRFVLHESSLRLNHEQLHIYLGRLFTYDQHVCIGCRHHLSFRVVVHFRVNKALVNLSQHVVTARTLRHADESHVCPKFLFGPHHQTVRVE